MSTYASDGAPDLAALLGGAPAAEPPPDTGASLTSGQKGDPSDLLRQAIMFVEAYMREEQDDEDLAAGASILKDIQSLLAAQQKLTDRATGAGPGARVVRRAAAQQRY